MRCLLAFSLVLVAGAMAPAAGQTPTAQLARSWVGTFRVYPTFVRMQVNLVDAPDGTLRADIRMEPLVGRAGGPMGVFSTPVRYDTVARTFEITPGPDAARVLGRQVPPFFGVVDPGGQTIAGMTGAGSPAMMGFFVLARAGTEEHLLSTMRDLANPAPARPGMFGGGGASPDTIKRWTAKLLEEYPDLNLAMDGTALFMMALALFDDAHFSTFFGKPFDRMSAGDLYGVFSTIQKMPFPRANFPEERPAGVARVMERAFIRMMGTGTTQDVTLAVLARRPIDAWRHDLVKRMAAMSLTPNVFAEFAAMETAEAKALVTFWPSERKAFASALVANRTRLAGPALRSAVDRLLASASGLPGAHQIAGVLASAQAAATRRAPQPGVPAAPRPGVVPGAQRPAGSASSDIAPLLSLVSAEMAAAEKGRLEARVNELVAAEAAKDRAALSSLGAGLAGLERGTQWYGQAIQRYGTLALRPPAQAVIAELARARSEPIRTSEAALTQQINAAANTAALSQVVQRYLGVPSDRQDAAGSRLYQLAEGRGRALAATETAAAQQRERAAREAASPCAKASTAAGDRPGEPTERDLCRAVEAHYIGADATVQALKGTCSGVNSTDAATALMCLMGLGGTIGGGPLMYVSSFQKVGCVPADGRPGFVCDYLSAVRSQNPITKGFLDLFGGEVSLSRFVKVGADWRMVQ